MLQEAPTSLHIIFAGLIFILSFFQTESPRFLVKKGKNEQALKSLTRIRQLNADHEYIIHEFNAIKASYQEELEASMGAGWLGPIKETFMVRSNLYRMYLIFMAQVLSQWSGAGSITLYAPDLFKLLGVDGTNNSLLVTGVFGIVKLIGALVCALFLVDVIGRKRALLIGITLQSISMVYIAGFLTGVPEMGVAEGYTPSPSEVGPGRGAIAMIYISGLGWSLGWDGMQYLLSAELFPLRIRALATSIAMTLHFVNQYGNTRAMPNMLLPVSQDGISPKGTFWCFAAITIVGGLWVFVSVPETGGRTLESMDRLFALPWYKIGLQGNKDADERDMAVSDEKDQYVEEVERSGRV